MQATPAYGRDYKSKAAALLDWEAGCDFIVQDIMSAWDGKPISIFDARRIGLKTITLRYKQNTMTFEARITKP